jgi:ABC-type lipoprotein release transport system permease subunit
MLNILIKGIDPRQRVIVIPSSKLDTVPDVIPAVMGTGMAASSRLKKGDVVSLRWRDKNGAFDSAEIGIADVFRTPVPTVDGGQLWIPLDKLRKMLLLPGEATILVESNPPGPVQPETEWTFRDLNYLLTDIEDIMKAKTTGGAVLWGILLMLAMLAVFDTQVLSIFRRQKQIGTYIAMGMTRSQVVWLFTVEGAMHSVLAAAVGAVYGIPLLALQAVRGLSFPVKGEDYGISMPDTIYPVYSLKLIIATVLIVFIMTTLVSYWPSRKIARMKPTDALRGKAL